MDQLQINTALQIAKPITAVFEAITDPGQMSNYFIEEGSAPLKNQARVVWKFPEFDEHFPIDVVEVTAPNRIAFNWQGTRDAKTLVQINLLQMDPQTTLVKISEGKLPANKAGLQWYGQNTEGWANFLVCLKAWVEHGVNLRKGAYDFMKI